MINWDALHDINHEPVRRIAEGVTQLKNPYTDRRAQRFDRNRAMANIKTQRTARNASARFPVAPKPAATAQPKEPAQPGEVDFYTRPAADPVKDLSAYDTPINAPGPPPARPDRLVASGLAKITPAAAPQTRIQRWGSTLSSQWADIQADRITRSTMAAHARRTTRATPASPPAPATPSTTPSTPTQPRLQRWGQALRERQADIQAARITKSTMDAYNRRRPAATAPTPDNSPTAATPKPLPPINYRQLRQPHSPTSTEGASYSNYRHASPGTVTDPRQIHTDLTRQLGYQPDHHMGHADAFQQGSTSHTTAIKTPSKNGTQERLF